MRLCIALEGTGMAYSIQVYLARYCNTGTINITTTSFKLGETTILDNHLTCTAYQLHDDCSQLLLYLGSTLAHHSLMV